LGPIADLYPVGKRKIFCLCRESKHNSSVDLFVASRYTDLHVSLQNFSGFVENLRREKAKNVYNSSPPSSTPLLALDDSIRNNQ
jgi:hypothetical protein